LADTTYNVRLNSAKAICKILNQQTEKHDLLSLITAYLSENLLKAKAQ
jgi:hypothetical protein